MTALPAKNPRESETAMAWFISIALVLAVALTVLWCGYAVGGGL